MTFGERLKQLRTEKKLTQAELSKIIMVNQGTIACYETNKKFPTHDNLKRLANFFNVSIDYLVGRTDIPNQIQEKNAEYKIDDKFTDEELNLIQKYRQSSDKGKKIIKTIVEIESNDEQAATGK